MTKVTIIKSDQKKMIPISEGVHGKWYKIAKYGKNPRIEGEIGIYLHHSYFIGASYSHLVSPDGMHYSHEDIFIEELSEVVVSVKE